MRRRQTRFIIHVIETMIRNYGSEFSLQIVRDSVTVDDEANETVTKTAVTINRPVAMDSNASREFIQRLSSVVANREFSYGMIFDRDNKDFLFSPRQLGTWLPEMSDYIVWNTRRWEIVKIQQFENNTGWVISTREVKGNRVQALYQPGARNRLLFGQAVSNA